jgi:hypothetical protein
MAMAYDIARDQVVAFGGLGRRGFLNDTWTWDGTTWTQEHPASSPPRRWAMGMAYDAARGDIVLFGGGNSGAGELNDTWTWDGTTWTQQHPATSPRHREGMGMTYDAARGQVVLFGGAQPAHQRFFDDTWTWDGTTWTEQHPATSPAGRWGLGMTDDAARGEIVLFGGTNNVDFGDTWTWDGATWTRQHPATSPSARWFMGMAYDATRGNVVLFDGDNSQFVIGDTWTWDGATWTQHGRPTHVRARMATTYDPGRHEIVLFGGENSQGDLGDTWTWDGSHWRIPFVAYSDCSPSSGPPGTVVRVNGAGFAAFEQVTITFVDSVTGKTGLGSFMTHATGTVKARVTVPLDSTVGAQKITVEGAMSHQQAKATFTVT